jgi:hypothetical protein
MALAGIVGLGLPSLAGFTGFAPGMNPDFLYTVRPEDEQKKNE